MIELVCIQKPDTLGRDATTVWRKLALPPRRNSPSCYLPSYKPDKLHFSYESSFDCQPGPNPGFVERASQPASRPLLINENVLPLINNVTIGSISVAHTSALMRTQFLHIERSSTATIIRAVATWRATTNKSMTIYTIFK